MRMDRVAEKRNHKDNNDEDPRERSHKTPIPHIRSSSRRRADQGTVWEWERSGGEWMRGVMGEGEGRGVEEVGRGPQLSLNGTPVNVYGVPSDGRIGWDGGDPAACSKS